jgi:hypothetical protein
MTDIGMRLGTRFRGPADLHREIAVVGESEASKALGEPITHTRWGFGKQWLLTPYKDTHHVLPLLIAESLDKLTS